MVDRERPFDAASFAKLHIKVASKATLMGRPEVVRLALAGAQLLGVEVPESAIFIWVDMAYGTAIRNQIRRRLNLVRAYPMSGLEPKELINNLWSSYQTSLRLESEQAENRRRFFENQTS